MWHVAILVVSVARRRCAGEIVGIALFMAVSKTCGLPQVHVSRSR
jgi:hypothetical protein